MNIHDFIKQNFNTDSVIFEIGSHFGTDTVKLISVTENIHCFEPDYRSIEIFKKHNLPVPLNECAVSDIDGEVDFYHSSGNVYESIFGPTDNMLVNVNDWSASSSIKKPKNHIIKVPWVKFNDTSKVKTIRIDSYCEENKIQKVDFVWMDVQGSEIEVIKGMGDFINKINFIYTEYSNEELYEGQPTMNNILEILGSNWEVLFDFGGDLLIKNNKFS